MSSATTHIRKRLARPLHLALAVLTAALALTAIGPAPAGAAEVKPIHFPVDGVVRYSNDFGSPRSGGRTHEGNDLMGSKMQPLVAAVGAS